MNSTQTFCQHGYAIAHAGRSERCLTCRMEVELAALRAELERVMVERDAALTDAARLEWWEGHLNYEHYQEYETGFVQMQREIGNVNDRTRRVVSVGENLRQAIDNAMVTTGHGALREALGEGATDA